MTNIYYLFALGTFILCVAMMIMILVRLGCGHCRRARLKYTVVLVAALIAAMQPYFSDRFPGLGSTVLALSMLWLLVDGVSPFRKYKDMQDCCYDTQIFDPDEHGEA